MRKKFIAAIIFTFMLSLSPVYALELQDNYDVIIAGAGTGGMAAAIQAARMGRSVLVLEPSGWIGGQAIAAGVSTMDDLSALESGLYLEFVNRLRAYYGAMGKSIGTCYWDKRSIAFEPFVGRKMLLEMAGEGDNAPEIVYHASVVSVEEEGQTVRGVTVRTPDGTRKVACKILIDATEYGDVLPLAGARYRLGNSLSPNINLNAMIQDITWVAVLRKYPGGVPENLRPEKPLPGYEQAKKNYEGFVTLNGANFEGVYPVTMPVNVPTHNAYRGLPNSFEPGDYDAERENWAKITKTGVNWGNDYPGQYTWKGRLGLPAAYLENPELRAQVEKDALIKTLHYIYYVQNELGGRDWSVDDKEYGELPEAAKDLPAEWREVARHLPPIPYVRESRRVLGDTTLNSTTLYHNCRSYSDGRGNHEFPDAIAIGCYILDLHHSGEDADLELELGERNVSFQDDKPAGNFQVPMSILIPKDVDGLLAAEKNLSMTRLVSGALRLQPITMMTGQAAGALAALSIREGVQPREFRALPVQRALVDAGVVLSLCSYSDVPPEHPFYGSVQLSNLYGLVKPLEYPIAPTFSHINEPEAPEITEARELGRDKGLFGVNEPVLRKDAADMTARAITALGLTVPFPTLNEPERPITRGEFALLLKDVLGARVDAEVKDAPLTRGEAVDRLVRAMEAFCVR